ncbi:MAG: dTDP-4-dehydrorhamnose reductase [Gammaproteobacteria bacterium]|nr:dTDP-4-dehydrorhamnose reductase [Gammaproteobacteria bacterium]
MSEGRTVLITGAKGQLGWELQRRAPQGYTLIAVDADVLDITNTDKVLDFVSQHKPTVIINCAAYTAVDKAEHESSLAYAVNALGAENLALAAHDLAARFVHISTDFIFDGLQTRPYATTDTPAPLGVYGASKLEGEQRVMEAYDQSAIVRTAWVYSAHGHNFVKTMLRLMRERDEVRVVADQIGTPTWASHLAQTVWSIAKHKMQGVYHYTDAGVASWYDFAVAVYEEAQALGLLTRDVAVRPIRTVDYPTPARRPVCAVLDKSALWAMPEINVAHWRVGLRQMLQDLKNYAQ